MSEKMATIRVTRKLSDGNYGSAEASLEVQVSTEQLEDGFEKAWSLTNTQVEGQLGESAGTPSVTRTTPAETDITDVFPNTEVQSNVTGVDGMDAAAFAAHYNSLGSDDVRRTKAQKQAALQRLQTHANEFWDNRSAKKSGERNPKAPDFSWGKGDAEPHRDDADVAIWVD